MSKKKQKDTSRKTAEVQATKPRTAQTVNSRRIPAGAIMAGGGMLDASAPIPHLMDYQADSFDGYADEIASFGARSEARKNCLREYLNSGYAKNAARVWGYHVVGVNGPQLYLLEECGLEKSEREALEWEFWFWQKRTKDVRKIRTALRACMFAGEAFQRFVYDRNVPEVNFNIEEIEAQRVDCPWHDSDPNAFDGITYSGQFAKTYKILKKDINPDYYNGFEFEEVPAREVMHLANLEMPGQHRGLPIFAAVVRLMQETVIWEKYTLGAAAWAARWGGFVKTNVQMDYDQLGTPSSPVIPGPNPGDLFFLEDGYTPEQVKAEYPTATFDDFKRSQLNEIGAGCGMPLGILAADTSAYNYSSWRGEKQNYWGYVDEWQEIIKDELMEPRFAFWLECFASCKRKTAAIARKLLDVWDNDPARIPHEWKNKLPESADPEKDRKADEIGLRIGTLSIHQICAREGIDYDQLRREREQEKEDFKEEYATLLGTQGVAAAGDWSNILTDLKDDTMAALTDGKSEGQELSESAQTSQTAEQQPTTNTVASPLHLLTSRQAAEKIGVSPSQILRWRQHGLNSYQIAGSPPRFDENELTDFVRNHNTTRGTPDDND